ncbi:sigma-54 dependent transcriptional regulator [bacterium]|nr:sigma-54 dependent transcriptional regulator [bacterium]
MKNDTAILIVDDEQSVRNSLQKWFVTEGFNVSTAKNADEAMAILRSQSIDLVLLDIKMPGMNGIEFNRWIRSQNPDIIVIMMTAFASVDTAVEALKDGAYDYVAKPIDPDDLTHIVRNALEKRSLATENTQLKQQIAALSMPEDIIGESPKIKHVLEMVAAVANTDATVMIRGESGTGKELVARAIHSNSARRYAPIISVNCGAVAESLLESELFGHEKGAFTGASARRKGKLERAHKGTVFFDEIGTIGTKMQVELLRVLESKRFTRVGGETPIDVDFRVISATNHDLEAAVAAGAFREDLYFRLNVFSITIPPLRDRAEDIEPLAKYFVTRIARSMSRPVKSISKEGIQMMLTYDWPGNIRELRNVIERAIVLCKGDTIEPPDLSFPFTFRSKQPAGDTLEEVEKAHMQRVLERCDWNISQAAKLLDIDRTTLYSKIKKFDLRQP